MSITADGRATIGRIPFADLLVDGRLDAFWATARGATIFHTPEWNQIVREVFATDGFYLVAEVTGVLVGLMPCHIVNDPPACHSPARHLETPYGGPVATGDSGQQVCLRLMRAASRLAPSGQVVIFTSPQAYKFPKPGLGWKTDGLETAYVDLRLPLEAIWQSSIDKKRRNMIRKAQKVDVNIRVGGAESVSDYYELVQQMTARAGIRLHPSQYYRRVVEDFAPRDAARVYLAYHEGHILAGGIFLRFGPTVYYWHGARADAAPNLGQGELIQWEAIQWAKSAGSLTYDLVGIEKERLPEIAEFKLGFSQELAPFMVMTYTPLWLRAGRRLTGLTRRLNLSKTKSFGLYHTEQGDTSGTLCGTW